MGLVIISHRSSKSTFGANKLECIPSVILSDAYQLVHTWQSSSALYSQLFDPGSDSRQIQASIRDFLKMIFHFGIISFVVLAEVADGGPEKKVNVPRI